MFRKMIAAVGCTVMLLSFSVTARAADTATLTITPEESSVVADGGATQVTFTISITPPAGKEIGVFSFRLEPSGDMVLPAAFKVDNQKVISITSNDLRYDSGTGEGVFQTYEYTPESSFFAAVGSSEGRRMTQAAQIMTITATVPAGSTGAYTLDAEFTAAPDGSGETYIGKVASTPVTVASTAAQAASGSKGAETAQTQKLGTVIVSDLDGPVAGQKPDTDIALTTGDSSKTEYTVTWYCDGAAISDDTFSPGHIYTVVVHVKTDGAFDSTVYTNAGFSVNRLSDTDLELRRSYYVEAAYTQAITEEEAESQLEQIPGEEPVEAQEAGPIPETEAAAQAQEKNAAGLPVLLVFAAVFLAAAILQIAYPGGLRALFGKKQTKIEK